MWKKILRIIAIIIMIIAVIFCIFAVLAYAEVLSAVLPASLACIGALSPGALLAIAALGGVLANIVSKEGAAVVMNGVSSAVENTATQAGTVAGGLVSGVASAVGGLITGNNGLIYLGIGLLLFFLFKNRKGAESAGSDIANEEPSHNVMIHPRDTTNKGRNYA